MTQQDTVKILALISEAYPKFNDGRNPQITAKLWASLFQDEPYEWVEKAVMAFIATDTKGFAPMPGAIKEKIAELTDSQEPTEAEAWAMVMKALHRSGYNSTEEFNKLPREIQEIVGYPGQLYEWAMMDVSEVNTVVASNFQRSYRARTDARKTFGRLPESFRIALPKKEEAALPEAQPARLEPKYEYCEMPQSFRDIVEKALFQTG